MDKKYCPRCKKNKVFSLFNKNITKKHGLSSYCTICINESNKTYNQRYKKRMAEYASMYRKKYPARTNKWKKMSESLYKHDFSKFVDYLHRRMRHRINNKKTYKNKNICRKDDFVKFAFSSKKLMILFERWVESGNYLWIKPSVDRIDSDKGYDIDNIQFMTHYENTCKQTRDYVCIPLPAIGTSLQSRCKKLSNG